MCMYVLYTHVHTYVYGEPPPECVTWMWVLMYVPPHPLPAPLRGVRRRAPLDPVDRAESCLGDVTDGLAIVIGQPSASLSLSAPRPSAG